MTDSPATKSLLACLHRSLSPEMREQLSTLPPETWESVLALALAHDVCPLLYHRLKQHSLLEMLPGPVLMQLLDAYRGNTASNMNLYLHVGRIFSALLQQNIQVIVLKGAMLAEVIYGNIELRGMSDIDLLVPHEQIMVARNVLIDLGFVSKYGDEVDNPIQPAQHLAPLVTKHDVAVELHWTITTPEQSHSIDSKPLLARACPVKISGHDVFGLSPEDLLLHLCGHLSYQHGFDFGLRPFVDIDTTIEYYGDKLDWRIVVQRAHEWHWQRGVYVSLLLAHSLVGANVLSETLEALKPDDLDDELVAMAMMTALVDPTESASISVNVTSFQGEKSLRDKLSVLLASIFLPRKHLALMYEVDPNSLKVFLYYPVRLADVLSRYTHVMWRLWRGDSKLVDVARRKHMLQQWLSNKI